MEIRSNAESLSSLRSTLDATWESTSKQRLMAEYNVLPENVDGCTELLDSLAAQVESITVTEWYTIVEKVWHPQNIK